MCTASFVHDVFDRCFIKSSMNWDRNDRFEYGSVISNEPFDAIAPAYDHHFFLHTSPVSAVELCVWCGITG